MKQVLITLLWIIIVATAAVWAYNYGGMVEREKSVDTQAQATKEYIVKNNQGCNDIVRHITDDGYDNYLVCEINMQAEDDALFIIKEPGSYDDYIAN